MFLSAHFGADGNKQKAPYGVPFLLVIMGMFIVVVETLPERVAFVLC